MSVTQCIKKINAWAEILGENVIGPLFYREKFYSVAFLKMLKGKIETLITQVLKNCR